MAANPKHVKFIIQIKNILLSRRVTLPIFTGLTGKNYFTGKFTGNWPVKLIPNIDNSNADASLEKLPSVKNTNV